MTEKTAIPKYSFNKRRNALIKAEQVLIGSLLVLPSLFTDLHCKLSADLFYIDAHKAAFELARQKKCRDRYFTDTLRHKKAGFSRNFVLEYVKTSQLERQQALDYLAKLISRATSDIPTLTEYVKLLRKEAKNNYEGWQDKK